MGVTWFAGWAGVGFLMELIDRSGQIADIWPAVLGIPGFFGGVVFSAVLGIAAGRRRFDELSLRSFAALGAGAGVLLGAIPFVVFGAPADEVGLWRVVAVVFGTTTALSTISATGTLLLARMADDRELLAASDDVAEVGLSEGEARKLLGGEG
jgi:hypothetical protein